MRFLKIFSLILFPALTIARPAAALPDGISPGAWESLLQKIVAEGERSESYAGTYLTLKRIEPTDIFVSHRADYVSGVGAFNEDGAFQTGRVEAVFEGWTKLDTGNWEIDQWLFPLTLDGRSKQSYHVHILEDGTGSVLEHELTPLSNEEAAREAGPRLREML